MAILAQPSEAPTTSPAAQEQSLSVTLTVEVMVDPDTGKPTLCTAADPTLGDFRETSHARAHGMVADVRAKLDQIERLIAEHEARDILAAIVAEHDLTIEEWDTATIPQLLRDHLGAWRTRGDGGGCLIIVPAGQDPIKRLTDVRDLILEAQSQTTEAQA